MRDFHLAGVDLPGHVKAKHAEATFRCLLCTDGGFFGSEPALYEHMSAMHKVTHSRDY